MYSKTQQRLDANGCCMIRLTYKVSEIIWDTDGQECDLPTECLVNILVSSDMTEDDIEDSISDAITDMVSFCHKGFKYEESQ